MRKSRAVKWLIGLLCLGIACSLLILIQTPEPLLLSRSTFVTRSDHFQQYNWQSDHSIFLFRQRSEPPYSWLCATVDLHTGQRASSFSFTKQFELQSTGARSFETSPDGKWLLWSTVHGGWQSRQPLHATGWLENLETGHTEHFPIGWFTSTDTSEPNRLYWMGDSKSFAEIDFGRSMYDSVGPGPVGGPTVIRSVNTPLQAKKLQKRSDWHLQEYAEIHVSSEKHIVAATVPYYDRSTNQNTPPELVQTSLQRESSPTQHRPLTMPNATLFIHEISFSPRGDRYAISALVDSHPAWLDSLRQWHIPVRIPSHPKVGIWILTLDGKQQQEVGHITPERYKGDIAPWPYEMPYYLRWSPDGKQLGFVYKSDLYRVPTD